MKCYKLLGLLFACCINISAAISQSLYNIDVPIASQSTDDIQVGIKKGVQSVILGLTGSSSQAKTLANNIKRVDDLIQQYSLQTVKGKGYLLHINFIGSKIKQRIPANDLLPKKIPTTLVWLADNNQLLSANTGSDLINQIDVGLTARKMPHVFPLLDLTDIKQINVSDISGSFVDNIKHASQRYRIKQILAIAVNLKNKQYHSNWTLIKADQLYTWQQTDDAIHKTVNNGLDHLAQLFVSQYNNNNKLNRQHQVTIVVMGLQNLLAVSHAKRFLENNAVVSKVVLAQISSDSSTFAITLTSDEQQFSKTLSHSKQLQRINDNQYQWNG